MFVVDVLKGPVYWQESSTTGTFCQRESKDDGALRVLFITHQAVWITRVAIKVARAGDYAARLRSGSFEELKALLLEGVPVGSS